MKINPLSILVINNNQKEETLRVLRRLEGLEYPDFSLIIIESDIYADESIQNDLQDVTIPYRIISTGKVDNLASCIMLSLPVTRANGSDWLMVLDKSLEIKERQLFRLKKRLGLVDKASILFVTSARRDHLEKLDLIGKEILFYNVSSFCMSIQGWQPESYLTTGFYKGFELVDLSLKGRDLGLLPYAAGLKVTKRTDSLSPGVWYYWGRNLVLIWRRHRGSGHLQIGMWVMLLWLKFQIRLIGFERREDRRTFARGMSDGWSMDLFAK